MNAYFEFGFIDENKKDSSYYIWIVVAGAFVITMIVCGAFYSYGVFFKPILLEFGLSRKSASGVVFVTGLTYAATISLGGFLADRYGYKLVMTIIACLLGFSFLLASQVQKTWQLYLFVGFFPGCGTSIAVVLPLSMVAKWFIRRRGLALGIASAGIGVGTALVPLMVAYLISIHGWRITYVILGLLIWFTCIPAILIAMRHPQPNNFKVQGNEVLTAIDHPHPGDKNRELSLTQALSTTAFWLLFALYSFCILSLGVIMIHLVPYATDRGLSSITAASLLTNIGICSIIGRVMAGGTSDRFRAIPILVACLGIQAIMMLWLIQAEVTWMFHLFATFFGISSGAAMVLIPKMTSSIFGLKSMGAIFGGLSVADGLGFAIGPLFAGFLFDITGNYDNSFLSVAAWISGAAILALILRALHRDIVF